MVARPSVLALTALGGGLGAGVGALIGARAAHLSISHTTEHAIAQVILER